MAANSLSRQQLVTDRIVAIVFLCLGVIFEMIWLLPSLMSVMISDSGVTPIQELGIILIIVGPMVTVVALAITTIILLALKRRAMIAGIFTLVAPILMVALGAALAFAGT
jgi:hypothetical protein